MEHMELSKALEALKDGKKRKFTQTIDLVVNLQNFDVRKEALNTFLNIPHPLEKRVAAFLTKRSPVVPTITEADFSRYKDMKEIKKLSKQYDFFMAVAPMMGKVATKFGRVLGPVGKMPSPQAGIIPKEEEGAIKAMYDKMQKVIRVRNKEMSIKLPVGKEDMNQAHVIENIESIVSQLESKLPRGKDNIKNVLVKFTMSRPIKFIDNTRK